MTAETDLDAPFAPDWVLVPRLPTDAMLRAAQSAWLNDPQRRTTTMWSAMLAAAPSPAATPRQPAGVDGAKETDLWRCTVCGRVGTVGRCCGEETRERANMESLLAEIEALRAEVAEWKRVASAQAELHGEAEARAERLAEALRKLEEREQSDEALLRQALEALERGAWDTLSGRNAAFAIRERLGLEQEEGHEQ